MNARLALSRRPRRVALCDYAAALCTGWFMTELAKHLGVPPSSLQRELGSMVQAGFLLRRQDGRRIYFKANNDSPLFPELRGIVEKTTGVVPALTTALGRFGEKISIA